MKILRGKTIYLKFAKDESPYRLESGNRDFHAVHTGFYEQQSELDKEIMRSIRPDALAILQSLR